MPRTRRVTILLNDEEYKVLKQKAGIASLSAYIKDRLENCWCQKTVLDVARKADSWDEELRNDEYLRDKAKRAHAAEDSKAEDVSGDADVHRTRRGSSSSGGRAGAGAKVSACAHGIPKGYHCWQCKGLAVIE